MTRRSASGFSLVEVLTVMGILGVVLTTLASSLNHTIPAWRVRQTAVEVASTLRAARTRAMLNRTDANIPFDVTRKRYTVLSGSGVEKIVVISGARIATLPGNVRFTDPSGYQSVTLDPPGTESHAATFNSKGMLRSDTVPGYVYLGDTARKVYFRVAVNSIGMVRVERWNGVAWQ